MQAQQQQSFLPNEPASLSAKIEERQRIKELQASLKPPLAYGAVQRQSSLAQYKTPQQAASRKFDAHDLRYSHDEDAYALGAGANSVSGFLQAPFQNSASPQKRGGSRPPVSPGKPPLGLS